MKNYITFAMVLFVAATSFGDVIVYNKTTGAIRDTHKDGTTLGGLDPVFSAGTGTAGSATNISEVVDFTDTHADDTADAELSQELLGNFISAVTNTWEDVTFTGSRKQIRQLTRRLVTETKAQALILDDETKTITERLAATSELRKLDTLAGYAAQLGIGQKKGQ